MKIRDYAVDKIKEKLSDKHTVDLLKTDLLGIRLREQIFWPEDNRIKKDPVRRSTSALLAAGGKKTFWLLVGGLIESRLKLTKKLDSGGISGPVGFTTKGLLDFYCLHPYALEIKETPGKFLKDHSVDLPSSAEKALQLLPGTTFQFMGKGAANLSAGVSYRKGPASVSLSAAKKIEGIYTLRLIREKGDVVRVVLSQVLERSRNVKMTAKLGWSVDVGRLLKDEWLDRAEEEIDALGLDKITESIPGWDEETSLADFIYEQGVEKGLKKINGFINDYTSFYATLGRTSMQKQRVLTGFRLDLSQKKACQAFESLLHLDEAGAALLAEDGDSGVSRAVYEENENRDTRFFNLGFPGKKLMLASSLRSEREGFLVYDSTYQMMRTAKFTRSYNGILSGTKKIRWEGLDVKVDGRIAPLSYWRFSFSSHDKFAGKEEIVRFCRFAQLLGASPADESHIAEYPWYKKLFGKKDDTDLDLDIYFTEDGVHSIRNSTKNQIRKNCFQSAARLGDIEPGAPWHDHTCRGLMSQYQDLLFDITGESDEDKELLQSKYEARGWKRDLEKDAKVLKVANDLIKQLSYTKNDEKDPEQKWEQIFASIGMSRHFNYMVPIAALARLAGEDDTLLDNLELKRTENKKVLVMAEEKSDIISADALFSQAAKTAESGG